MQYFTYKEKIEALLEHYKFSTKLAEALKVHRMSIQNWKEDSVSISKENKLNIDVLFSAHCIIPNLKKSDVDHKVRQITQENHEHLTSPINTTKKPPKLHSNGKREDTLNCSA